MAGTGVFVARYRWLTRTLQECRKNVTKSLGDVSRHSVAVSQ